MGHWICEKCKTGTADYINRCSFCGAPPPEVPVKQQIKEKVDSNLAQSVHRAVEKLHPAQIRRLWRWMEDNIL